MSDGDGYLLGAFVAFIQGLTMLFLGVFASKILTGQLILVGVGGFLILFALLGVYLYKHNGELIK